MGSRSKRNGGKPGAETGRAFTALPYHVELRDYLKAYEPDLWKWFASAKVKKEQDDARRIELLKRTYRLTRESHASLYDTLDKSAAIVGVDVPMHLYQAEAQGDGLNAAISIVNDEIYIVVMGDLVEVLSENELRAIFGHELSHYHFWKIEDGEFEVAGRVIDTMAAHEGAHASHYHSARLFSLYTEVFCDRGAKLACGELTDCVAALVKTATGLRTVDGQTYLQQAREIFAGKGSHKTEGFTHPENFIRARALELWSVGKRAYEKAISSMIQGSPEIDTLDLINQKHMEEVTRLLLDSLLSPGWFQTDVNLAHARQFFQGYEPQESPGK